MFFLPRRWEIAAGAFAPSQFPEESNITSEAKQSSGSMGHWIPACAGMTAG